MANRWTENNICVQDALGYIGHPWKLGPSDDAPASSRRAGGETGGGGGVARRRGS